MLKSISHSDFLAVFGIRNTKYHEGVCFCVISCQARVGKTQNSMRKGFL